MQSPSPSTYEISFSRILDVAPVTDRASTGGVSWIDYDGDGFLDLYVTNGYDVSASEATPQPNRLYKNIDGSRFEEVEAGPLTSDEGFSSGSAWADIDNDGDPDLYVTNQRGQTNFLYRNEGNGSFKKILSDPTVTDSSASFSASWADIDNDGLVDLFIGNGGLSSSQPNLLLRNLGDFAFERQMIEGVTDDTAGTASVAWADFDGDGLQDLFVANRWSYADPSGPGMSRLYRNLGEWQFESVLDPPTGDTLNALTGTWGDFDGDTRTDLYLTNASGSNRLYRNSESSRFERIEAGLPVLDGGSSYAATWGDLNNNGKLDLLVGNWGSALVIYENMGNGRFQRIEEAGELARTISHVGSMALSDFNGDGALDLYVGNWPNTPGRAEENELYLNRGNVGNWIVIRLEGTNSNRSGIGAKVIVKSQIQGREQIQMRELGTQPSWRSQAGLRLHFGLNNASQVDEMIVHWPSGEVQRFNDLPVNKGITVIEGGEWRSGLEW